MFVSEIIDEASEILATTDQNKVFRTLTQAVQILMESGHYFHTNQEVDVCTGWDGQTITLPRGIEVPLAVNIDGSPTYFRGRLFQYNVNKGGMYNPVGWAWDDRGFVATQMDIRQPSQLIAVSEHSADAGLQIRVVGTDGNNRELRTQFPDGTTADGLLVPIHAQSDFPYGTIIPDQVTIQTRDVAISPISQFTSTNHQLQSGQSAVLSLVSGTMPKFLYAGQTYYIGVDDANTIQLYQTSLDAKAGTNPIFLQSILNTGTIKLTDSRPSNLLTAINLQSTPVIAVDSPNEVTFSVGGAIATATISGNAVSNVNLVTGGTGYLTAPTVEFIGGGGSNASVTAVVSNGVVTGFTGLSGGSGYTSAPSVVFSAATGSLPSPLAANTTYFAQSLDTTDLQIYSTITDAQNGTNPVLLTGNSGKFNTDIRKQIAPQTTLTFAVKHYYQNVDEVQAFTSGGTLPTPLLAGQNYFVHVIDDYTLSIHTNAADASSGNNPIVLTDAGTGTNSLVKLIPATTSAGTTNQIIAAGLKIPTPTSTTAANAIATVSGSITSVKITSGGSKYTSAPVVTFDNPQKSYSFTGDTSTSVDPKIIKNVSNVIHIVIGQTIAGSGIPNGTIVTAVGSTTITISNNATATATGVSFVVQPTIPANSAQSFSTATGYAVMVPDAVGSTTYSVGSIVITSSGQGYTSAPAVTIDPPPVNLNFTANTQNNSNTITSVSPTTGLVSGLAVYGLNIPDNTTIVSVSATNVVLSNAATATATGVALVAVSVASANQAKAIANLETSFVSNIVIPSGAGGSGYDNAPIVQINGGGGTGATATAQVSGGVVTSVSVVTQGTGYTSAPAIIFVPSTGVFVEFSTTGTMPTPLTAGTAYRIESPLNTSTGTYTITNADYTPINVTGSPSGNFYVALTRAFGIGFNGNWAGNFNGVVTGQGVYLASDYLLPTGVDSTTEYYLRVLNSGTAQVYDSQSHANGSPATTGLITPTALGVGQSYFAIRIASYAKAFNNLIVPSSIEYLANGDRVQFSSTGSLPYPLNVDTDYLITISGNNVSLTNTSGTPIVFANAGVPTLPVGQMSMNIARTFTPVSSTSIIANGSIFEAGDQVIVRASAGDSLPSGLTAGNYYARTISANKIELYDTEANAINTTSHTGRVSYLTTGNTISSTFFIDSVLPPTFVKSVLHIEKPETIGYVSLYAYDYGRSNDMALIGQYHPAEVNPKYRRIRIGKQCSWARIIYRMAHPNITSVYDYIPIENTRAIMAAVHAVDLENKDFEEQSNKYWAKALTYLRSQHESMTGHALEPIQVDNLVYGDYTDPVIDSNWGYYGGY